MPAHAADLGVAPVYKAPPVAPVTTWTGSYIGIAGGGVWGRGLVTNGTTGFNETPRFDVNGGIFGITSGFNYQAGSWVLGYEGDTSITSVKGPLLRNRAVHHDVLQPAQGAVAVDLSRAGSATPTTVG